MLNMVIQEHSVQIFIKKIQYEGFVQNQPILFK